MRKISYKELYSTIPKNYKLVRFGKGQKLHIVPDFINQPYCIKSRNKSLDLAFEIIEVTNIEEYKGNDLCNSCYQMRPLD